MKRPKVQTLAELMQWIADRHHAGSILPIASKIGVSPALVGFWARGETKEPKIQNLQRLAEVYDLDFLWLLALVHGKKLTPISGGGAAALPRPVDRPSGDKGKSHLSAVSARTYSRHYVNFARARACALHLFSVTGPEALNALAA